MKKILLASIVTCTAMVANAEDWSGLYAGAQLGMGNFSIDGTGDASVDGTGLALEAPYGIHFGYAWAFEEFIIGGELSYNKLAAKSGDETLDDESLLGLSARVGLPIGNFQPYVKIGASQISLEDSGTSVTENGVVYGLGAEYLLSDKIILGAEFVRNSFTNISDTSADVDVDTMQFRLSYKF